MLNFDYILPSKDVIVNNYWKKRNLGDECPNLILEDRIQNTEYRRRKTEDRNQK